MWSISELGQRTTDLANEQDRETKAALENAKRALINYALLPPHEIGTDTDKGRYNVFTEDVKIPWRRFSFPCPDVSNVNSVGNLTPARAAGDQNLDGVSDSAHAPCGFSLTETPERPWEPLVSGSRFGRLPWRTFSGQVSGNYAFIRGVDAGDIRDGYNNRLWYVVARPITDNPHEIYAASNPTQLRRSTDWMAVFDADGNLISDRVAAFIISPGAANEARLSEDAIFAGAGDNTPDLPAAETGAINAFYPKYLEPSTYGTFVNNLFESNRGEVTLQDGSEDWHDQVAWITIDELTGEGSRNLEVVEGGRTDEDGIFDLVSGETHNLGVIDILEDHLNRVGFLPDPAAIYYRESLTGNGRGGTERLYRSEGLSDHPPVAGYPSIVNRDQEDAQLGMQILTNITVQLNDVVFPLSALPPVYILAGTEISATILSGSGYTDVSVIAPPYNVALSELDTELEVEPLSSAKVAALSAAGHYPTNGLFGLAALDNVPNNNLLEGDFSDLQFPLNVAHEDTFSFVETGAFDSGGVTPMSVVLAEPLYSQLQTDDLLDAIEFSAVPRAQSTLVNNDGAEVIEALPPYSAEVLLPAGTIITLDANLVQARLPVEFGFLGDYNITTNVVTFNEAPERPVRLLPHADEAREAVYVTTQIAVPDVPAAAGVQSGGFGLLPFDSDERRFGIRQLGVDPEVSIYISLYAPFPAITRPGVEMTILTRDMARLVPNPPPGQPTPRAGVRNTPLPSPVVIPEGREVTLPEGARIIYPVGAFLDVGYDFTIPSGSQVEMPKGSIISVVVLATTGGSSQTQIAPSGLPYADLTTNTEMAFTLHNGGVLHLGDSVPVIEAGESKIEQLFNIEALSGFHAYSVSLDLSTTPPTPVRVPFGAFAFGNFPDERIFQPFTGRMRGAPIGSPRRQLTSDDILVSPSRLRGQFMTHPRIIINEADDEAVESASNVTVRLASVIGVHDTDQTEVINIPGGMPVVFDESTEFYFPPYHTIFVDISEVNYINSEGARVTVQVMDEIPIPAGTRIFSPRILDELLALTLASGETPDEILLNSEITLSVANYFTGITVVSGVVTVTATIANPGTSGDPSYTITITSDIDNPQPPPATITGAVATLTVVPHPGVATSIASVVVTATVAGSYDVRVTVGAFFDRFMLFPEADMLVEDVSGATSPANLIRDGSLIDLVGGEVLGQDSGIHHFKRAAEDLQLVSSEDVRIYFGEDVTLHTEAPLYYVIRDDLSDDIELYKITSEIFQAQAVYYDGTYPNGADGPEVSRNRILIDGEIEVPAGAHITYPKGRGLGFFNDFWTGGNPQSNLLPENAVLYIPPGESLRADVRQGNFVARETYAGPAWINLSDGRTARVAMRSTDPGMRSAVILLRGKSHLTELIERRNNKQEVYIPIPSHAQMDLWGNMAVRADSGIFSEFVSDDLVELYQDYPIWYAVAPECRRHASFGADCAEEEGEGLTFQLEGGEEYVLQEDLVANDGVLITTSHPLASLQIIIKERDRYAAPRATVVVNGILVSARTGAVSIQHLPATLTPPDADDVIFINAVGAGDTRVYFGVNSFSADLASGNFHYADVVQQMTVHVGGYNAQPYHLAQAEIALNSNDSLTMGVGGRVRYNVQPGEKIFGTDSGARVIAGGNTYNLVLDDYIVTGDPSRTDMRMALTLLSDSTDVGELSDARLVAEAGDAIRTQQRDLIDFDSFEILNARSEPFTTDGNTAITLSPGYLWQGYIPPGTEITVSRRNAMVSAYVMFDTWVDNYPSDSKELHWPRGEAYLRVQSTAQVMNGWGSGTETPETLDGESRYANETNQVGFRYELCDDYARDSADIACHGDDTPLDGFTYSFQSAEESAEQGIVVQLNTSGDDDNIRYRVYDPSRPVGDRWSTRKSTRWRPRVLEFDLDDGTNGSWFGIGHYDGVFSRIAVHRFNSFVPRYEGSSDITSDQKFLNGYDSSWMEIYNNRDLWLGRRVERRESLEDDNRGQYMLSPISYNYHYDGSQMSGVGSGTSRELGWGHQNEEAFIRNVECNGGTNHAVFNMPNIPLSFNNIKLPYTWETHDTYHQHFNMTYPTHAINLHDARPGSSDPIFTNWHNNNIGVRADYRPEAPGRIITVTTLITIDVTTSWEIDQPYATTYITMLGVAGTHRYTFNDGSNTQALRRGYPVATVSLSNREVFGTITLNAESTDFTFSSDPIEYLIDGSTVSGAPAFQTTISLDVQGTLQHRVSAFTVTLGNDFLRENYDQNGIAGNGPIWADQTARGDPTGDPAHVSFAYSELRETVIYIPDLILGSITVTTDVFVSVTTHYYNQLRNTIIFGTTRDALQWSAGATVFETSGGGTTFDTRDPNITATLGFTVTTNFTVGFYNASPTETPPRIRGGTLTIVHSNAMVTAAVYREISIFGLQRDPNSAAPAALVTSHRAFTASDSESITLDMGMVFYLDRAFNHGDADDIALNTVSAADVSLADMVQVITLRRYNSGGSGGFDGGFNFWGPGAFVPPFGAHTTLAAQAAYAERSRLFNTIFNFPPLHSVYDANTGYCIAVPPAASDCAAMFANPNWHGILNGVMAFDGAVDIEAITPNSVGRSQLDPDSDDLSKEIRLLVPEPSIGTLPCVGTGCPPIADREILAGSMIFPESGLIYPARRVSLRTEELIENRQATPWDSDPVGSGALPGESGTSRVDVTLTVAHHDWRLDLLTFPAIAAVDVSPAIGHRPLHYHMTNRQRDGIRRGANPRRDVRVYSGHFNYAPTQTVFDGVTCFVVPEDFAQGWVASFDHQRVRRREQSVGFYRMYIKGDDSGPEPSDSGIRGTLRNRNDGGRGVYTNRVVAYDGTWHRGGLLDERGLHLMTVYHKGDFGLYFNNRIQPRTGSYSNYPSGGNVNDPTTYLDINSTHTYGFNNLINPPGGHSFFSSSYTFRNYCWDCNLAGENGYRFSNPFTLPIRNTDVALGNPQRFRWLGGADNPNGLRTSVLIGGQRIRDHVTSSRGSTRPSYLYVHSEGTEFNNLRLLHRIDFNGFANIPIRSFEGDFPYPHRREQYFQFPRGTDAFVVQADGSSWVSAHPILSRHLAGVKVQMDSNSAPEHLITISHINDGTREFDISERYVSHYRRSESDPVYHILGNTPVHTNVWIRTLYESKLRNSHTGESISLPPNTLFNPLLGTYLYLEEGLIGAGLTRDLSQDLQLTYRTRATPTDGDLAIAPPAVTIPKGSRVVVGNAGATLTNVKAAALFSVTPLEVTYCPSGSLDSTTGLNGTPVLINQVREAAEENRYETATGISIDENHPCMWIDEPENLDGDRMYLYRNRRRYATETTTNIASRVLTNDRTYTLGGTLSLN